MESEGGGINRTGAGQVSSDISDPLLKSNRDEKEFEDVYLNKEGREAAEEPTGIERTSSDHEEMFTPINPGDEATLTELALRMSRAQSHYSRRSSLASGGLEQQDTYVDQASTEASYALNIL
jgi:hypothetical protein